MNKRVKYYPPLEEKINIISHGLGTFLGLIALGILIYLSNNYDDNVYLFSALAFGLSFINLYAVSTIYHSIKKESLRVKLRAIDHASIYVFIAGTYTPFALIILPDKVGWTVFFLSWALALLGIVLKIFFTGRYIFLSLLTYLGMGWMIIFFLDPLVKNFSLPGLIWLLAGGVAYTLGAIVYALKKVKFNHAIFHLFVLIGSVCHFISIAFYAF